MERYSLIIEGIKYEYELTDIVVFATDIATKFITNPLPVSQG